MRNSIIATFVSFLRLPNLILIGLFMWFVRLFLLRPELESFNHEFLLSNPNFWLLVIDVQLVALISFWINDWFDRKIDAVNKPKRFLVKYEISRLFFYTVISILILLTVFISVYLATATHHTSELWILPLSLILVFLYAWKFKRIKVLGNLLVSSMIVAILALVLISENITQVIPSNFLETPLGLTVSSYAILMFTLNYARELVKDIEDVDGDRLGRVKSFPIILGVRKTQILAIGALAITVAAQCLYAVFLKSTSSVIIGSVLIVMLFGAMFKLNQANSTADFHRISQFIKFIMLLGVLQIALA